MTASLPAAPDDTVDTAAAARGFRAALLRFVRARVADPHAAEDIVQDVLLRLHRGRHQFGDDPMLGPWLFTVARHAVIDHYRVAGRQPEVLPIDGEHDGLGEEGLAGTLPVPGFTERDATRCLEGFVQALPAPMAQALQLVDLEGLTHREVAERTGLSVPGAKSRVQRARAAVREAVARCCALDFSHPQGLVAYEPAATQDCPRVCARSCASGPGSG
jgi:RNA polymerase sigma-70 factor (ECF subfamily)